MKTPRDSRPARPPSPAPDHTPTSPQSPEFGHPEHGSRPASGDRAPFFGRLLLRLRRLGTRREEVEADLHELFLQRVAERGRWYASLRYCVDAASLWIHRQEPRSDRRRSAWLGTIAVDLRYALRTLRNQPLSTCAIVVTLGLGIGVPTSVFSLLNGFVFRTPVTRDSETFFRVIRAHRGAQGIVTPPQYDALRSENRSARELAAWSRMSLSAPLGDEDPTHVTGLLVSCNFLRVFGVEAAVAGRLLQADDCAAARPVALLSEGLWRTRFGGDPSIIGSSVAYGGVAVTIVGVVSMAPIQIEAHDPDPDYVAGLWFPYTAHPVLKETSEIGFLLRDSFPWLELAGLLAPEISREAATSEFRLIEERRRDLFEWSQDEAMILTDGSRWAGMPTDMLSAFAMALSLPALLLVAACVNVAALLLSRAVSRQREMAVRLALGTSRAALMRMLLMESFLVAGLAAFASMLLVYSIPPMLVRFFDAELAFGPADALAPDARVFTFLLVSGVVAAIVSGLAPALESLNPHLAEALQGRRGFVARRGPSRTRRVFVAVQVAASMVLLVAAATFSHTASRFIDPGFRSEGLLVADIREEQNRGVSLSAIADDIGSTPGVAAVAYTERLPLVRESAMDIRIPGRSLVASPMTVAVSRGYFDLFDLPILAGRSFGRLDEGQVAGVWPIVVSRQLARRFLGTESVLGEVIEIEAAAIGGAGMRDAASGEAADTDNAERMTIIGICADRVTGRSNRYPALNDGSMIYELMDPSSLSGFLLVRTEDDPRAMADGIGDLLRELTGSPTPVQTFDAILAEEVIAVRRVQALLLAMGAVALLLAVIGVVATVTADAGRRTREFAIRLALGAAPSTVRRSVVLSGLRPIHVGLLFGLLASWGAMRTVESMHLLPLGSVATQPAPYVAVAVLLLAISTATLLAVAYPVCRRDPLDSLGDQ